MKDILYVYNVDSYVGQLVKDGDQYSFIIENDTTWFAQKAIENNSLDTITSSDVMREVMVIERVCPPTRQNIEEILLMYGLTHYDPWELLKKAYGMHINDTIWMHTEKVPGSWFWENHPYKDNTRREIAKYKHLIQGDYPGYKRKDK